MALSGEYVPGTVGFARRQVELYESSGGTEGTEFEGYGIVVLTSIGAKSGGLRKTPVMRVERDGEYAVVASKGGTPEQPSWYHNVKANPRVELQDGPVKREYLAHEVTGEARESWWEHAVATYPPYGEYQTRTDRIIPVFVLTPND